MTGSRVHTRALQQCLRLLGIVLAAATCGGDEPTAQQPPTPGELVVRLSSPSGDDAAVKFSLTASTGTISGVVESCSGCKLFLARRSETRYEGIVIGAVSPGPLLRVSVSDTRRSSDYTGKVEEVSGPDLALRDPAAYSLAFGS